MTNKKEDELVKLATKNFIKQKAEELCAFILYITFGIVIPYVVGIIGCLLISESQTKDIIFKYGWLGEWFIFWIWGFFIGCMIFLFGAIIFQIIKLCIDGLKGWITSNFEKAIKDAKKELKIK